MPVAVRRPRRRTIVVAGLAVAGAALGVFVYERSRGGTGGVGPAADPSGFYRAGAPGDGPRGEVLAREEMVAPAGVPEGTRVWRIRYRTLDASDTAVAASMAIAIPPGTATTPRPIVAWMHGAVGVAPGCAPSRSGLDMPYAAELLAAGIVVVAPDLTGLGIEGVTHPYLHGVTAGRSVLDAARAAALVAESDAGTAVALAGHSAGGHAALWANELAAGPDGEGLDVRLTVPMAAISDLPAAMDYYATTPGFAAFPVQLVATWPGVEPVESADALTPAAQARIAVLDEECLAGVLDTFGRDPQRWVRAEALAAGAWGEALARQSAGRAPGASPVVAVHGEQDGSALPVWSEQVVAGIRGNGGEAEFRPYAGADHGGIIDAARADVVGLLIDALSAAPA